MFISRVWDAAPPSATPGRVFTSSIGQEEIPQKAKFLDHLRIGLKGAVSTAAVTVEDFVGVLSLFTVRVGAETRIQMSGNDLVALMALYYKQRPYLGENSDNTGTDYVGGVKVPLHIPVDSNTRVYINADRTAVTNIGTETISVTAWWLDSNPGKKPIHAVVITDNTAGSTGMDQKNNVLPKVGRLVGLIVGIPAASDFTDANIDISTQRINLLRDSQAVAELNALGDNEPAVEVNAVSQSIFGDLLGRYKMFDFREEGFNLKDGNYTLQFDTEDASDAVRIIPVIHME